MIHQKVSETIKHIVNANEGIKSQDLMSRMAVEFIMLQLDEIKAVLMELVHNGDILEVEYIIRNKSRSFFLPTNTEIRIHEQIKP